MVFYTKRNYKFFNKVFFLSKYYMLIAVITIGRSGSSELISILNETKLNVIKKPFNYIIYCQNLRKDIKVIFITRYIKILIFLKKIENYSKD